MRMRRRMRREQQRPFDEIQALSPGVLRLIVATTHYTIVPFFSFHDSAYTREPACLAS